MANESRYTSERAKARERDEHARYTPSSALAGHVDYVDLAERVVQGVTVQSGGTRSIAEDRRERRRR